jgi:hypothetical protein
MGCYSSAVQIGRVVGISMGVERMKGNKSMTILRRCTNGLQLPRNKLLRN